MTRNDIIDILVYVKPEYLIDGWKKPWVGLTDEDRQEIERWIEFKEAGGNEPVPTQKIITYVEAKLKAKNHD